MQGPARSHSLSCLRVKVGSLGSISSSSSRVLLVTASCWLLVLAFHLRFLIHHPLQHICCNLFVLPLFPKHLLFWKCSIFTGQRTTTCLCPWCRGWFRGAPAGPLLGWSHEPPHLTADLRISQNASFSLPCFRVCAGVTHAARVLMSWLHPWSLEAVLASAIMMFLFGLQTYLLFSFPIIKLSSVLFNSCRTNPRSSARMTAPLNLSSN